MRVRFNPSEDDPQDPANKMLDWTNQSYRSYKDFVTIRDDDPIWTVIAKAALNFFGLILMIVLSPFLIIGLTIAFIAVF
mgnify:CR=1 FL=1